MSDLVPDGWRASKFSDVFDSYKYGPRFSSKDYSANGNVRTIRGTDVSASGEIHYSQVPIATIEQGVVDAHSLKQNDLVMITTADCGVTAVFNKQNIPYIASAYAIKLTPTKKIDSKYILYFMQTPDAMKQVGSLVRKGTVANLPGSDVMHLKFLCPPLPEQQKIAAILSSVDDVIEKTQAQIEKLKNLKTGMMQELLSPREPKADDQTAAQASKTNGLHHTEFKDSPLGRIPVGWEAYTIGELLESNIIDSIQDGNHGEKHPKAADFVPEGIPFVMASDIHDQEIDIEGANKIPEEIYKGLRIGFSKSQDVLLSHKATVGLTAVVPENVNRLMLTPQITYYRINDQTKLFNWFLHYCFQSGYFQERISILSAQSTRSYIGIKAQTELSIALPNNIEEQHKIVDVLKSLDLKKRLIKTKLCSLQNTKKALMQDLLTGKVRVQVDAA